jgi:endo-1,4-beta-xylanase
MKKYGKLLGIIVIPVLVLVIMTGLWLTRETDPYVSQPLPELPVPPLKELAEERGIEVGSFASLKYLRERPYSEILATEFSYAIIDGEPNWQFEDFALRPSRDTYDFAHMDQVFEFADQNDMPVRVQHLLWGDEKWLPEWLKSGNYSREELLAIIKDHIMTVGAMYRGKVREYTVVNEAFSRKLEFAGNKDWWGQRLGTDYIDQAFLWAREADPNAVLILNDFANEHSGDITDLMFEYVKSAIARGIPIDGVGMQMHIDGTNSVSREEAANTMRHFAELGVRVYVTEFDVNMHSFEGSTEERDQKQADVYYDLVKACVDVGAQICPNFGFLGLVDRQSWYSGIGQDDAEPLMFKDDYTPKPAFFSVRKAFED